MYNAFAREKVHFTIQVNNTSNDLCVVKAKYVDIG